MAKRPPTLAERSRQVKVWKRRQRERKSDEERLEAEHAETYEPLRKMMATAEREERRQQQHAPTVTFSDVGLADPAASTRLQRAQRRYLSRLTGLDPSQVEPWESRRSIPYALAVCVETSAGWRPVGW